MEEKKRRRPIYKRWWFWVLAAVILLIIIAAAAGGGNNTTNKTDGSVPNTVQPATGQTASPPASAATASAVPPAIVSPTASKTSAELQLSSGNYTAGTDFPAGTYDIVAVSGAGNVSSNNVYNGGINAVMGTKEANDAIGTDMYEQEYANISLPDGIVLSISGGVVIKISSDDADPVPLKSRQQPNTETISLGNGNFVSGKDFPAGTYDIVALSGGGNVSSDNLFSGGINAVMGSEKANEEIGSRLYEQAYRNIELPADTTLSIDGVEIQLIPSK